MFDAGRADRAAVAVGQPRKRQSGVLACGDGGPQPGQRRQQALFGAQRDLARARYDYLLGILELKSAAGRLSPADLEEINGLLVHDTLQVEDESVHHD